jgi:hypothetical protein
MACELVGKHTLASLAAVVSSKTVVGVTDVSSVVGQAPSNATSSADLCDREKLVFDPTTYRHLLDATRGFTESLIFLRNRLLFETTSTAASSFVSFEKFSEDLSNANEVLTTKLDKVFSELSPTADQAELLINLVKLELLEPTELVSSLFGKSLSDSNDSVSDTHHSLFNKVNLEVVPTAESWKTEIWKVLSDQATSTDDFMGVTNPDDDQTMLFNKSVKDSATAVESITIRRLVYLDLFETGDYFLEDYVSGEYVIPRGGPVALDSIILESAGEMRDLSSMLESASASLDKLINDQVDLMIEFSSSLEKSETELVGCGEMAHSFMEKHTHETSASQESYLVEFSKGIGENVSHQEDLFGLNISKTFRDGVISTDDFMGVTNPDDDQTMLFNKSIKDTMSGVSELSHTEFMKNLNEEPGTTDSGWMLLQNYFGEDYCDVTYTGTVINF